MLLSFYQVPGLLVYPRWLGWRTLVRCRPVQMRMDGAGLKSALQLGCVVRVSGRITLCIGGIIVVG